MNHELLTRAQQPGADPLRELTTAAHKDVVAALAAAIVRPQALELADFLEAEPMEKLREMAAPSLADVAAAKEALTEEQKGAPRRRARLTPRRAPRSRGSRPRSAAHPDE